MLGLPGDVTACLFDLDGVLTQTASVHRAAWQETFNDCLKRWEHNGEPLAPFDPASDYNDYVDGRPRADGVRAFFASRGIQVPDGDPDDPPDRDTVYGIGTRKNQIVQRRIRQDGVQVFEGAIAYLRATQEAGLRRAVVSASQNTREVLRVTGLTDLFEEVVDGVVAKDENLRGKPEPDTFLACAKRLGVSPRQAVVFEDAVAGVAAGRAGDFGFVVGVDRVGHAEELRRAGADVVVEDPVELLERP
ncbi:beta-phosphoglucomutase family hydrolase [Rugosimonospora africana]|uniref:Beta-phosphoglucomutase n=1 Tax=Rugosimonospora africana TaxID=556532 RepID=A0A8J3QW66_9ACTN|nr:beta-phosphoglucomutase family hydrolase [Rugosimonospora africana]GIH17641.1 hydrolase [Rugosimonospora africana]